VSGAWGPDSERQKLLQFQQEPNQDYFVVLYPRSKDEPIPTFSSIDSGKGVCVRLPDRADWAFLSQEPVQMREQDVQFHGRAGVAQRGKGWRRLTLLEGRMIAMGDLAVHNVEGNGRGGINLSVTLAPDLRVEAESFGEIRSVRISIPGAWEPVDQILVNGHMVRWAKDSERTYLLPLRKAEGSRAGSN
jgi:hypothetical protein